LKENSGTPQSATTGTPQSMTTRTPPAVNTDTATKKRKRTDEVSSALKILYPRKTGGFFYMETWGNTSECLTSKSYQLYASDLLQHLKIISKSKLEHAARTLKTLINNKIFDSVRDSITGIRSRDHLKESQLDKQIVDNIRRCLAHHNVGGGSREKNVQSSIDAVLAAACFTDNTIFSDNALGNRLGTNAKSIKKARLAAAEIIRTGKQLKPVPRKIRKDCIQPAARRYIIEFCRSDEYSRIDNSAVKPIKVVCPYTKEEEEVQRRVWLVAGACYNFDLFLKSSMYETFKSENPGSTIGLTIFRTHLCPSVKEKSVK